MAAHFLIDRDSLAMLNIEALFMLRYTYDKAEDVVDLAQDIRDLAIFPERLEGSYRQEWCTYVAKAIAKERKTSNSDQDYELSKLLKQRLKALKTSNTAEYQALLQVVQQAKQLCEANNVAVFTHPLKRNIEKFLDL